MTMESVEFNDPLESRQERPINLGKDRLAGREPNTAILILSFDKLPLREQQRVLEILKRKFRNVTKIICSATSITPPSKKRQKIF